MGQKISSILSALSTPELLPLMAVKHRTGVLYNLTDDFPLADKDLYSQTMVFPVVMYRGESWTIKKVEHQRMDAFELWCWRRLLRVSWTARRSNQ